MCEHILEHFHIAQSVSQSHVNLSLEVASTLHVLVLGTDSHWEKQFHGLRNGGCTSLFVAGTTTGPPLAMEVGI